MSPCVYLSYANESICPYAYVRVSFPELYYEICNSSDYENRSPSPETYRTFFSIFVQFAWVHGKGPPGASRNALWNDVVIARYAYCRH